MRRVVASVMGLLVVAAVTAAVLRAVDTSRQRALEGRLAAVQRTVAAFAGAWGDGDWQALRVLLADPRSGAAERHARVSAELGDVLPMVEPGSVELAGDAASARLSIAWQLDRFGAWQYETRLLLRDTPAGWRVTWRPAVLHPNLRAGQRLDVTYQWPERGAILARDGTVLADGDDKVAVGLRGERLEDPQRAIRALTRLAGANPTRVRAAARQAAGRPDEFVPVIDIRRGDFETVQDRLIPIPGVFFVAHPRYRADAAAVPSGLLGHTGPLTRAGVDRLGDVYRPGDVAGLSGIEAAYEDRLAGEPAAELRIVDREGNAVEVLRRSPSTGPRPVRLTIDLDLQRTAQAALEGATAPAALVVVDAQTGQVRAAANEPTYGFDRALSGYYPPGSTFKVVTTATLLANRVVTPTTLIDCPSSVTVGGRTFDNAGGAAYGRVPFRVAFYRSCNTAFVQLAARLTPRQQVAGARRFGFTGEADAGRFAGATFPRPADVVEQAAAGIGQGRVTAGPLHMASVAAAVAGGVWRPPTVVVGDPAPGEPYRLPARDARILRSLMRDVVIRGTGTAAAVPGRDIGGKTGTAEYGSGNPPPTHAWFIGFADELAVAVVVEGGGFGGEAAAPIAAEFFAAAAR